MTGVTLSALDDTFAHVSLMSSSREPSRELEPSLHAAFKGGVFSAPYTCTGLSVISEGAVKSWRI
jgi:hypothetical protein